MAPKEPFKVYSLSKHIENTNKGLYTESQYNRRPANRATVVKKESGSHNPNDIFKNGGDNEDDEDSSSDGDSDSSSDGEGTSNFLKKLGATGLKTSTPSRRRDKNMEIADSDAERNASAKAAPAKKAANPKPESESDDSSSESESESEPEAKAKTNGAVKASDSTSSSSESESESESDDDAPAKPAQSAKAAPQDDSSDSSSEEASSEPETKAKPTMNGKTAPASAPQSDSSEESESESDEEPAKSASKVVEVEAESSSDEDSDDEMVDESMHIEDRQVLRKASAPKFIAPDFVLRKGDDGASGKDVAEICSQANLEGKQVWYFTVPANVPISVVQNMEIPMDNSLQGGALFSHDGDDYGVSFESIAPKSNIQILIPSADSTQYRSSSRPVSQVMQVKKITQLASLPSSSIGPASKRAARPQPKGLKSRYQPLGISQIEAEEDIEMTEAPVAVAETKASKKEKKKKSREVLNEDVATPVSRKGKRKHTTSEEDAVAAAEQLQAENKSAAKKSKKQKTDRSGSPDLGSEPPSTKKQTRVLPPTIPQATPSGTPAAKASSPATASTVKKSKKPKESKVELPIMPSKQTPVPFPSVPFSSQSNATTASPSVIKEEKRSKKRKEKEAAKKSSSSSKVTPIPPPKIGTSS